jgi:ribose/xylose/arabinose/galactoside ABC-type transport system permease subunit
MALSGMLTAWVLQRTLPADASATVAIPLATIGAVGIGLACGLVNGLLVASLRMHPFIVTLGTLSIYRCLATAPFPVKTIQSLAAVRGVFGIELFGMRVVPLAVMLLVVLFGWIYLHLSVRGRETYAVGGNEEAARFSGIDVGRTKVRVYAISGLLAGLAGLVSLGRFGTMSASSASGYELTVVAAAVVGGASLAGGRGTAVGALLGTLILAMIENGINIVPPEPGVEVGDRRPVRLSSPSRSNRVSGQWRAWRRRGRQPGGS